MKCCVIRNANGDVVAAHPISPDGKFRFEIELEKGETATEIDIPDEAMRDPELFRKACSPQLP